MKKLKIILLFLLAANGSFSQPSKNNYILWSSIRKLTATDFVIKTKNLQSNSSFAQFNIDYAVNGFDFMTKNFNKKVNNYFIKSASWIDTTYDTVTSIKYQQTLFDIAEIYARYFRNELKKNRKKIASGTNFIKEVNATIMSDFANRRIAYDTETNSETDAVIQQQWQIQIKKELDELKDFSNLKE